MLDIPFSFFFLFGSFQLADIWCLLLLPPLLCYMCTLIPLFLWQRCCWIGVPKECKNFVHSFFLQAFLSLAINHCDTIKEILMEIGRLEMLFLLVACNIIKWRHLVDSLLKWLRDQWNLKHMQWVMVYRNRICRKNFKKFK